MSGWQGSTVRKWRRYWGPVIAAGERNGTPLVCPFYLIDRECPGPVLTTQAWDVDHRVQRVDGGHLGLDNQAPAHTSCNRRAGQATARFRMSERTTRVRRWS